VEGGCVDDRGPEGDVAGYFVPARAYLGKAVRDSDVISLPEDHANTNVYGISGLGVDGVDPWSVTTSAVDEPGVYARLCSESYR
jgi:hypothetical protein